MAKHRSFVVSLFLVGIVGMNFHQQGAAQTEMSYVETTKKNLQFNFDEISEFKDEDIRQERISLRNRASGFLSRMHDLNENELRELYPNGWAADWQETRELEGGSRKQETTTEGHANTAGKTIAIIHREATDE